MPGMLGLSGDLAGLAPDQRAQVAAAVAFYKTWRRFITASVAHLLAPPESMDHREGWGGVQLQAPDGDDSLVFIYRLGNAGAPPALPLRGLSASLHYAVQCGFNPEAVTAEYSGADLLHEGLQLPTAGGLAALGCGAEVFRIRALPRA
jgi:alpha-galactosidase